MYNIKTAKIRFTAKLKKKWSTKWFPYFDWNKTIFYVVSYFFPEIFKYIQYFPNLYLNFIQSVLYFCTQHWYTSELTIQTYFTFFRCFWFSCRIWMDFVSTLWAVEAPTAKFICNGNPWLKKLTLLQYTTNLKYHTVLKHLWTETHSNRKVIHKIEEHL